MTGLWGSMKSSLRDFSTRKDKGGVGGGGILAVARTPVLCTQYVSEHMRYI